MVHFRAARKLNRNMPRAWLSIMQIACSNISLNQIFVSAPLSVFILVLPSIVYIISYNLNCSSFYPPYVSSWFILLNHFFKIYYINLWSVVSVSGNSRSFKCTITLLIFPIIVGLLENLAQTIIIGNHFWTIFFPVIPPGWSNTILIQFRWFWQSSLF